MRARSEPPRGVRESPRPKLTGAAAAALSSPALARTRSPLGDKSSRFAQRLTQQLNVFVTPYLKTLLWLNTWNTAAENCQLLTLSVELPSLLY